MEADALLIRLEGSYKPWVKTAAVVFDAEANMSTVRGQADFDVRGAGMLDDVVKGFLTDAEKVDLEFGW